MKNHRISAGGIVIQNNKVLLVHHYRPNEFDFWVLPGGGVEGDEGILKAAEREVYEETNLEIEITALVGVSSNQIAPSLHSIVTIFTADVIAGTPKAGDDLVELRWMSKSSIFPEMMFKADEIAIKRCLGNNIIRIPVDHELWINRK